MNVRAKQIASYMLLPGVVPRVKELALDLRWFAYLMALIFSATRILPPNHPYTSPEHARDYTLQDVLFEAGRHLKGGARNIDQYIVYVSFVLGVILLLGQFVVLLFILATHTAEAATTMPSFRGMFITRDPTNDLGMMMLDKVFEIPNMFYSKYNVATTGTTLFGHGLHGIFFFYNEGMLFIAGLIVIYYIFAVVIETAQTGTPFGQRFQEVYVPIRIILALAFLVPLGYGFSAGQMLVLKLAQWGSGFATNGWIIFNQRAQLNPLGSEALQLTVLPKNEDIASMIRFYSLTQSCRAIYMQQYGKNIKPYIIYKDSSYKDVSADASTLDFVSAYEAVGRKAVTVTFGEKNDKFTSFPGNVKAYCGSMTLPTSDSQFETAEQIHASYWTFMQQLWSDTNMIAYGNRMARNFSQKKDVAADNVTVDGWPDADGPPEVGFYANVRTDLQSRFEAAMEGIKSQIRDTDEARMKMETDVLLRGWGGAGIWFNKIAEYNGVIVSAAHDVPVPSAYPAALSQLGKRKQESETGMTSLTKFLPTFNGGTTLKDAMSGSGLDEAAKDGQIATFLGSIYNDMSREDIYGNGHEFHDDNPVANAVAAIFGTEGLSQLRGNEQIHPLAKMSALGKSIINRAVTYLGGAMVMGGLSGLSSILDHMPGMRGMNFGRSIGAISSGFGSMFVQFAYVGILVGFVLYYVIPFLPFLYFFFAVGRWVKSIFEAIVGIPLWALAHLRIDGEGVPGEAAAQGYFLLLEILLRPILVVFGLLAAVSCFSALAIVLDTVFDLVMGNVTGHDPVSASGAYNFAGMDIKRSNIDEFFYTVVYAVLLYLMALSCFKLIDLIPAGVLRFIGNGVSSFNDELNLESNVVRNTAVAVYGTAREAGQAAQEMGQIIGGAAALPVDVMGQFMDNMPQPQTSQPQPQTPPPQAPAPAAKPAAPATTEAAPPAATSPAQPTTAQPKTAPSAAGAKPSTASADPAKAPPTNNSATEPPKGTTPQPIDPSKPPPKTPPDGKPK